MLSRRREQIVLMLGLVILNTLLAWDLNRLWHEYQRRIQWISAPGSPAPGLTPIARSHASFGAQSFVEITNRNMFVPERTSQSPKEAVKPPELPLLYGTMNLGEGWFALIAPADQALLSRRVQVGEEVGGYKLVSVSGSKVVVKWGEQMFNIDVADSARRVAQNTSGGPKTTQAPGPAPVTTRSTGPAAASAQAGRVTMVAPPSSGPNVGSGGYKPSPAGYNAPPGAPVDAPEGTVLGGKRKVVIPSPFGTRVFWEDVEHQPSEQADKEAQTKER